MAGDYRWLEYAVWEQVYVVRLMSDWIYIGWQDDYWKGWIDKP